MQMLERGRRRRLPPFDACEKVATRVSSLSLVRYRLNDYSVPTTYGHRDVLVREKGHGRKGLQLRLFGREGLSDDHASEGNRPNFAPLCEFNRV
jgi:hypothetical protein